MPHVLPPPIGPPVRHLTLNTDGKPHPLENLLAGVTFVLGVVAFLLGLSTGLHAIGLVGADLHVPASGVGVVGTVVGLYAQLVSATTPERWLIVIGIGGAFVGGALGLAHGGFIP